MADATQVLQQGVQVVQVVAKAKFELATVQVLSREKHLVSIFIAQGFVDPLLAVRASGGRDDVAFHQGVESVIGLIGGIQLWRYQVLSVSEQLRILLNQARLVFTKVPPNWLAFEQVHSLAILSVVKSIWAVQQVKAEVKLVDASEHFLHLIRSHTLQGQEGIHVVLA